MIDVEDLLAATGAEDTAANRATLEELERNALAWVQNQTGRYFGPPEQVTEYITGTGGRRIYLRDHPVLDITEYYYDADTEVLVAEAAYPGADLTEIEETGFQVRLSEREFALWRLGDAQLWTASPYEYAITYYRGYLPGEEPGDIRQLVLDLVLVRWKIRAEGMTGLRSETIGGYSYTRFGNDDVDAVSGGWSTIHSWRRPVVA